MSDLVGNPEDWFSHNEAHFVTEIDKLMIKQIEEEEQRDCPEKPDVAVPVVPTGNEAAIEEEEVKGGKGKLVRCVTRGGVECMVRAPKGKGCKGPKKPTPVVPTTSAPGAAAPGADVPSADSPVPVPVPSGNYLYLYLSLFLAHLSRKLRGELIG